MRLNLRLDGELEAGELAGEYEISAKLGEGSFGVVYSATHPLIGKRAAVKVLGRELSKIPDGVSRFITEARAINTIRHRNITDVFNFGTLDDGRLYFVMELLEGTGLDGYLQEHRVVEPGLLCQIMSGVARALDAAHGKGVVHRDLKPENIFLHYEADGELTPKLLDFGVAKLLIGGESQKHRTGKGTPIGTPHYMSPEQCLALTLDHRTDLYSFGVVCFEALTGQPPFTGDSLLELMNLHTRAKRPRVSDVAPQLGRRFDEALRVMMAIDMEQRPSSAGEALTLLLAAYAGADLASVDQAAGSGPESSVPVPPASEPTSSPASEAVISRPALSTAAIRRLQYTPTDLAPMPRPVAPPLDDRRGMSQERTDEMPLSAFDESTPEQPAPEAAAPASQPTALPGVAGAADWPMRQPGQHATDLEAIMGGAYPGGAPAGRRPHMRPWLAVAAGSALAIMIVLAWLGLRAGFSSSDDGGGPATALPATARTEQSAAVEPSAEVDETGVGGEARSAAAGVGSEADEDDAGVPAGSASSGALASPAPGVPPEPSLSAPAPSPRPWRPLPKSSGDAFKTQ